MSKWKGEYIARKKLMWNSIFRVHEDTSTQTREGPPLQPLKSLKLFTDNSFAKGYVKKAA